MTHGLWRLFETHSLVAAIALKVPRAVLARFQCELFAEERSGPQPTEERSAGSDRFGRAEM